MMTTERNVSEIFQCMAEDVNGESCVPYDRFDWPYVVFEANIADPYSLNQSMITRSRFILGLQVIHSPV